MPRKMDDGSVSNKPHQHHTPSRIPAPKTGRYQVKNVENGYDKGETGSRTTAGNPSNKRFETFVMTGDMIIQTTSLHHKPEVAKDSPTQKRKREVKHSPVLVKKEGRSNITRPSDSPKASPKRKPPQRAVIESPKVSPKKVIHSPQATRKEPECSKGSPKSEARKSPVRQSRLPRFTPKNSPKLSQKHPSSGSESGTGSDPRSNVERKTTDTNKGNFGSGDRNDLPEKDSAVIVVDTNGASPPHLIHVDKKQCGLELLGYPRFPDVPVELDIPPDDISSEDEKFKHEAMVDIDDLPPPPEEFFTQEPTVSQEQQLIRPISNVPDLLEVCASYSSEPEHITESNTDIKAAEEIRGDSVEQANKELLQNAVEHDLKQNTDPELEIVDNHIFGGCSQQEDASVTTADPRPEHIINTEAETVMDMATLPEPESTQECANKDLDQSGSVSPMHQDSSLDGMDSVSMGDKDSEGLKSDASETAASSEASVHHTCNTGSPAHHGRSASVSNSSAIDSSTISINSDSKVDLQKGSPNRTIVVSKSAEKIAPNKSSSSSTSNKNISDNLVVRCSKSHENYLERNEVITFVDIDLEENMASSVDALHHEKSSSSLESLNYVQFHEQSHSEGTSPDKHPEKAATEHKLMPTFINLEEARSITKLKEGAKLRDFSKSRTDMPATSHTSPSKMKRAEDKRMPDLSPSHAKVSAIPIRDASSRPPRSPKTTAPKQLRNVDSQQSKSNHVMPETSTDKDEASIKNVEDATAVIESPTESAKLYVVHTDLPTEEEPPIATSSAPPSPSPEDAEEGADVPHECQRSGGQDSSPDSEKDFSLYHQPLKEIDRPSAARLAKRLFQLDGFRKGDITRHLCKKNDFSYLVGEEYLKFFYFTGMTLDQALRNFLKNLTLAGETQERERVLAHFSRRYLENNPGSFNSEDACHTLVCALMLLNTDLHGQNIGRKMTVNEFIENLADLNDGENFPKEILKNLYHSIKTEPLECHLEDEHDAEAMSSQAQRAGLSQDAQRYIGQNPFLDIPDPSKTTEYKKGYVMRKCCVNADGRRTPMGKRGWKMFFATLKDLVLYLHKDDRGFKKNAMVASTANAIRIHHALAFRATDYKKKQHVFHLQTADWAQYLFQASNSKECQEWIDTINFVAASLSAPPLPGGCGSQRKFERPLLPASYTRLNMREQAQHHEQRMLQMEQELHEHRKHPPEKGAKSRFIQDYVEKETYLQFELKRFKVYSALLQMKLATFPELEPSLVEVAIGEVDEPNSLPSSPEQPRVIPLEADLATEQGTATSSSSSSSSAAAAVSPSGPNRSSKPVQRSMSDRVQVRRRSHSAGEALLSANAPKSPTPIFTSPGSAIPCPAPTRPRHNSDKSNRAPSENPLTFLHAFETQV